MNYIKRYHTPEGFSDLILVSDGSCLTGLCFEGTKDSKDAHGEEKDLPVFEETVRWLDIYFQGKEPDFLPPYRLSAGSAFREEVSEQMKQIPFGKTLTYGELAETMAKKRGIKKMSAQAVGNADRATPSHSG